MCNDLGRELNTKKQYPPDQIDFILKGIDRNQDGRLSLDEVYLLMRKLNP